MAALRSAPLLHWPVVTFNNQSAFFSSLMKDTGPEAVSTSFVSKPMGLLPMAPPSIDHCLLNLIGAIIAMRCQQTATAVVACTCNEAPRLLRHPSTIAAWV